jgi:hypothetical protein
MQARVRQDYRYKSIVALSGQEYVKGEWRPVPVEREKEAARHPFLDVREMPVKAMPIQTEPVVEEKPAKVSDKKAAKGRR